MRLKKYTKVFAVVAVIALCGCAPTEEEKAKEKAENEGNSGTPPPVVVIPNLSFESIGTVLEPVNGYQSFTEKVMLSSAITSRVTAKYTIAPLTATVGSDFEAKSGTLEIPAGARSADIDFTVLGDDLDENDEAFSITLSDPSNATISDGNAVDVVKIKDSDIDATVSFETDFAQVAEGAGLYKVKVKLSTQSEKQVEIPFAVSGLATRGVDFTLDTRSPISVSAESVEAEISLNFLSDDIPEGGESVVLQLETPNNAGLGKITQLTLTIPGDVGLNDTGVTSWYNGSDFNDVSSNSEYPGQDAEFGRDTKSHFEFDGPVAFSFTKLDDAGNALPSNATNAQCVLDNRTGLVFELKQPEQTLPTLRGEALTKQLDEQIKGSYPYYPSHRNWRAKNFAYYWYNDNGTTNGGGAGTQGGEFVKTTHPISSVCAFPDNNSPSYNPEHNRCNTKVLADAFNSVAICGFQDWRLPTVTELRSTYNYRATAAASGEVDYFPNTMDGDYISATSSADGSGAAWCMSTSTGQVHLCNKHIANYVRMVRGGAQ